MPDTSIPINEGARDSLRSCKRGNETYSDVIERLIEEAGYEKYL